MMSKRDAGRLGGLATLAKHGREHMCTIGRRGAAVFWQRYALQPIDVAAWAIVDRTTGQAVAITNYNHAR